MSDYTVEQEKNPQDKDYLKWFIWHLDGDCINENEPCQTEEEAWEFIPPYLADKEERAWERQQERMMEDGSSPSINRAEESQRMIEYQKLK